MFLIPLMTCIMQGIPPLELTTRPALVLERDVGDGTRLLIDQRLVRRRPLSEAEKRDKTISRARICVRCTAWKANTEGSEYLWSADFCEWPGWGMYALLKVMDAKLLDDDVLVIVYLHAFSVHADVIAPDVADGTLLPEVTGIFENNLRPYSRPGSVILSGPEIEFRKLYQAQIEGTLRENNLSVTLSGHENVRFELRPDGDAYRWVRVSPPWQAVSGKPATQPEANKQQ